MSGGEALDLALGLLRAPARRDLLAARSLPDGMTTLLEVAGGSSSAARAAADSTGASPEELLDAARFFVQQVLFIEGASAYRVLGAERRAPQSRLHHHHRLLQRWLHPDRDGGEAWDSAFSARVNEAWARVRTPQARSAYDAEHRARPDVPEAGRPGWRRPPLPVPRGETPAPPRPRAGVAGPLIAIAGVLACIVLAWLVHQRDLRAHAELFSVETAATSAAISEIPDVPRTPATLVVGHAGPTYGDTDHVQDEAPDSHGETPATPGDPPEISVAAPATPGDLSEPAGNPPAARGDAADALPTPPTHVVGHARPTHGDTARTPAPPQPEDPLLLLQQAEQSVAHLTAYLSSDGQHVPPIWNDFPAEAVAADIRARLHLRLAGQRPGSIDLGSPHWRLDDQRAVFDADYRASGPGNDEQGRIRIEMTRRDRRWLVTSLRLEPSA